MQKKLCRYNQSIESDSEFPKMIFVNHLNSC